MVAPLQVDHIKKLSVQDLRSKYIAKKKPVLISNALSNWPAIDKWTPEYFKSLSPDLGITVKSFDNKSVCKTKLTLSDYVQYLNEGCYSKDGRLINDLLYWHDVPIFSEIPKLISDVDSFFLNAIPKWYSRQWWQYAQFFMGPKSCVTPLHFDCLLTNNLFFQISGRKKFILLSYKDGRYCKRYGWRWFDVNPENPDYQKNPEFRLANPVEVIVNPGDILYIPTGTLHYVRSLDNCISFNIDFHTHRSLMESALKSFRGMPFQNLYYNAICALGIIAKVPSKYVFRYYKSYLNYIS